MSIVETVGSLSSPYSEACHSAVCLATLEADSLWCSKAESPGAKCAKTSCGFFDTLRLRLRLKLSVTFHTILND
jgi:hypothetical protein